VTGSNGAVVLPTLYLREKFKLPAAVPTSSCLKLISSAAGVSRSY